MIDVQDPRRCCACLACVQVCPVSCIAVKRDEEGFPYPEADAGGCIGCGLCEKVCPYLSSVSSGEWDRSRRPLQLWAVWNKDEELRKESSSGGVFSALAEKVLAKGGRVFGAAFNEDWQVCHRVVDNARDLAALRSSKYVQSDTGHTFSEAKALLEEGRPVLYSGTPCQIAGLRSFLHQDYPHLYLVDFVCHGVPSPGVWDSYREEVRGSFGRVGGAMAEVHSVSFRDKGKGWRNYSLRIGTSAGTLAETRKENAWLQGFLNDLFLRPSCTVCPFKAFASRSDLTLSDFWTLGKYLKGRDDDKGASLLYVNTEKGRRILEESADLLDRTEVEKYKYPLVLFSPASYNPAQKIFYSHWHSGVSVSDSVKAALPRNPYRKKWRRFKQRLRQAFMRREKYRKG